MNASSPSRGRLMTLVLSALTLALLLAACTAGTPSPTATPTPTPTPTPEPDPIAAIGANATWGDLASLLPSDVTACVKSELGAEYEALLARRIFDTSLTASTDAIPLRCFDQESLVDLFIASVAQAADGLSSETTSCLRDAFAGLNPDTLSGLSSGDMGESMDDAMNAGIGMLLCLTDDEAERITAGNLFGESFGGTDLSLKDIRCVFQSVDITQLLSMVESMSSGESTATPDISQMLELLEATQQCGIDLGSLMSGDTSPDGGEDIVVNEPIDIPTFDLSQIDQLPPELQESVRCLIAAVGGEENAQGFLDGTYAPELSQLMAAFECNVDPNALNEFASAQ